MYYVLHARVVPRSEIDVLHYGGVNHHIYYFRCYGFYGENVNNIVLMCILRLFKVSKAALFRYCYGRIWKDYYSNVLLNPQMLSHIYYQINTF